MRPTGTTGGCREAKAEAPRQRGDDDVICVIAKLAPTHTRGPAENGR